MAEVCRAPRERSFPLRLTVRFADANNVRRVDGLARFFLGSCVRMRAGREPIAPALHVNRSETGDAPGIAMMQRNAAAGQPAIWNASARCWPPCLM